jgi:hypothetical protein
MLLSQQQDTQHTPLAPVKRGRGVGGEGATASMPQRGEQKGDKDRSPSSVTSVTSVTSVSSVSSVVKKTPPKTTPARQISG